MPVSLNNSQVVYDALKKCGIGLMSALPETWLVRRIGMAGHDPPMNIAYCCSPSFSASVVEVFVA